MYVLFVLKTYGQMEGGELQRLRYHILNFFQDIKIRVSVFMRQHWQNSCGSFVIKPCGPIPYSKYVIALGEQLEFSFQHHVVKSPTRAGADAPRFQHNPSFKLWAYKPKN